MGHIRGLNEQLRIRIQPKLIGQATEVCEELGITPTAAVSMLFAQMVKLRALPFQPSSFPALAEYGAALEQVTAAEDAARAEIQATKSKPFTGKL